MGPVACAAAAGDTPRVRASILQSLAAGAGLALGMLAALPARGDAKAPTISPDEIHEGMKGYGLTVFHGFQPQRFDVEVIGVLHNFRPAQDLILVKTPNPRLDITHNVQGMSGSPIYLDGRLAGAYAYSLRGFMTESVAGITPIGPMLKELHRPIPPGFWPLQGGAPLPAAQARPPVRRASLDDGPTRWDGPPGQYDLLAHARQVAARLGPTGDASRGITPAATPLVVAGVGSRTMGMVRTLFGPLGLDPVAGGGAGQAAAKGETIPTHFVDGGSLGVLLAGGDVSFMGLGTVTHVEGQKLCAFGHPMMGAGDTALPTAIARVLWIYASQQHSFKVGEAIKPYGTLVQDRMSAVVADETRRAPVIPVHIDVTGVVGAPKTSWNMTISQEKFMSASLTASMFGSVVEATTAERRDLTWKVRSRVHVRGHGTIDVDDFGVAIGGMPETGDWFQSRVVRLVGGTLNNPWENVAIDRIDATLSVDYSRQLWRLRGVDALDPVVDAGDKARFVLHFLPFAGPEVTRTVEVVVPPELAGKDAEVEVYPGYEVTPDVAPPENLNQLLANATRQTETPRSIVVQIKLPTQGLAFNGHIAPRLPYSMLDALRPATSDIAPQRFVSYARTVIPLPNYVDGHDKLKIKVREKLR